MASAPTIISQPATVLSSARGVGSAGYVASSISSAATPSFSHVSAAAPALRTSYGAAPGSPMTTRVSTSVGVTQSTLTQSAVAPAAPVSGINPAGVTVSSSSSAPASTTIRVNGAATSYGKVGGPVVNSLTFKAGDKVTIASSMAAHAGKVAYVEGVDGDQVRVRLEGIINEFGDKGPGQQVVSLNPMHLQSGSGGAQPAAQASAVSAAALQLSSSAPPGGFPVGAKVFLGGSACPPQYCGKYAYVVKPDCGDGTGRVKLRMEATYSTHDGFISTGGTFVKEVMTVEQAKVKCAIMGGKGFTHSGGQTAGLVQIFIKNKWDIQGTGWTSYKIEPDPDGLPSWTLLSPMHLTLC